MSGSLTTVVAQHYNQIQEKGLEERSQSRIFHMRNFNNWIKSMLIKEFSQKLTDEKNKKSDKLFILDIGSGKGGDLLKWKKGQIDHLVCADIAETSVQQCNQRYIEMKQRHKRQRERGYCFDAEFITADCTKDRLKDKYKDPNVLFDLVSAQFSFHYCFESLEQARMMIQNISESLKPGGYFIGTTPDSYDIMRRLQESSDNSFGNDVFSVTFPQKEGLPLFGAQYDFHLEGVVDCPEFLVYFPALVKLAEEKGLELLYRMRFDEFFETHRNSQEGQYLLTRMRSLETYPPLPGNKLMGGDDEYCYAKKNLKTIEPIKDDEDGDIYVGTLSQSEWEAVCMYIVFAFVKKVEVNKDVNTEDPKTKDGKTEDAKTEDMKTDDGKTEDAKTEDAKTEDMKTDDVKTDDVKTDDVKTEELKNE